MAIAFFAVFSASIWALWGFMAFVWHNTHTPQRAVGSYSEGSEQGLPIIQGNYLLSFSYLPDFKETQVLGMITSDEESPDDLLENKIRNMPLLNKIISCESNWKVDAINQKCGYQCGMGLGQLIPSRVKDCSQIFGREINPFDKFDNLSCALYLFEKDGYKHWGYDGAEWGSFQCFKNYIK